MRNYNVASATSSSSSRGGIGFFGALTILFIALKLIGIITWSWWWVLSPLWLPITVVLVVFFVAFVMILIKEAIVGKNTLSFVDKEPKNPKDWPYYQKYFCKCCICGSQYGGPKKTIVCWECAKESQKKHWLSFYEGEDDE